MNEIKNKALQMRWQCSVIQDACCESLEDTLSEFDVLQTQFNELAKLVKLERARRDGVDL